MKNISVIMLILSSLAIAALLVERQWLKSEVSELQTALQNQAQTTKRLTEEVSSLEAEIRQARPAASSYAPQASAPKEVIRAQDPEPKPVESLTVSEEAAESAAARVASWRAKEFVTHVSDYIALSAEEKETLGARFAAIATGVRGPDDVTRRKVIAEVLGDERLQAFEGAERARVAEERARALEEESVILSRRLSLTPQQEAQVRSVLEEVELSLEPSRVKVREVMREAMANHFGGDEAKNQLKEQYDLIRSLNEELKKQRAEQLFGALSDTLSDTQKNALLEYQASR